MLAFQLELKEPKKSEIESKASIEKRLLQVGKDLYELNKQILNQKALLSYDKSLLNGLNAKDRSPISYDTTEKLATEIGKKEKKLADLKERYEALKKEQKELIGKLKTTNTAEN